MPPFSQVTKKLWEYIKGNGLQDPNDGRMIMCDGQLRAIFGESTVHMFKLNKKLSEHMFKMD